MKVKRLTQETREQKGRGGSVRGNIYIIAGEGEQRFAVLKFPRQCPLVLSVKVVWKKVTLWN
jgi:hypothetical protein